MEGNMEADAQAYDELSKPQVEKGTKFIRELNLSQGDKVLDMGCGTGIVTKCIADIVGPDGQVVGIDPDAARIKIAQEKYKEISNLQFHVGSSATGFPHDNEPYYDAHISTAAFHWVPNDEKKIYIQKAHQCLNPEGKFTILCGVKVGDHDDRNYIPNWNPLTQDGYQKLFQDVGLFPNVVVKNVIYPARFKSFEELKRWAKASSHCDIDELDPVYVKEKLRETVAIEDDGSVIWKYPNACIRASKI